MDKIFIFGLARSGTSWLGSIFDAHPDTIYRFEPDASLFDQNLPYIFSDEEVPEYLERARKYALKLHDVKDVRTNGRPPFFRKTYRPALLHFLRILWSYMARSFGRLAGTRIARKIIVPDFIANRQNMVSVVKCVDSPGRLFLMASTLPECKFVFIIRHPCGVVNSWLRGAEQGKITKPKAYDDWLKINGARRRGLGKTDLAALSQLEIGSWSWLLHNESVLERTSQLQNVRLVNYDDLCRDPVSKTKELFEWCGLDFNEQVRGYLNKSLSNTDTQQDYYALVQQPEIAANKWRTQLTDEEKMRIKEIVADSEAGKIFYQT
ncbi:MAG: sulfotransferase [Nitrosomonas sp.]|nr:sulfotransferase [Nitrosomonas sp.]